MKFYKTISAVALAAGLMLPAGTAAMAAPATDTSVTSITQDQQAELRDFLTRNGVEEKTQNELLRKLDQGKPWDSFSGAQPVRSVKNVVNGVENVTKYYADGSVEVSSMDQAKSPAVSGAPSLRSVGGCRLTSGSHYHANYEGCHANVDFGVVQMGFYFDRQTNPGVSGRITRYYGMHHRIIGGALSNHRFVKFNNQQVRYAADFSVAFKGFPAGWTAWMQANLGSGTSAWTTHN